MKKCLLFFIALVITFASFAQTGKFSNVQIQNTLRIKDWSISNISNDSTLINKDSFSLPTEWAVYNFINNRTSTYYPLTGNPSNFLTSVPAQTWTSITSKPTFATVATSGNYNDLLGKPTIVAQVNSDWNSVSGVSQILNKPTIPTNNNQLTNGANYITAAGVPVTSVSGRTGAITLTKADVSGIENVDNTSDISKPISTATQNALNSKFTLPSLTAGSVLFSDGTTIAQDNANLNWDKVNKYLTIGGATSIAPEGLYLYAVNSAIYAPYGVKFTYWNGSAVVNSFGGDGVGRFSLYTIPDDAVGDFLTRNPSTGLVTRRTAAETKSDIGLSNVDNTSDISKPISTATQTALDAKISGAGTTNYLPKWTSSGTIGNSIIQDNGTIGIGTTSNVGSTVTVGNSATNGQAVFGYNYGANGTAFGTFNYTGNNGSGIVGYSYVTDSATTSGHDNYAYGVRGLAYPASGLWSGTSVGGYFTAGGATTNLALWTQDGDIRFATVANAVGDFVTRNPATGNINRRTLTETKSDLGISNVDNTSDINKPISTAQSAYNNDLQNQITNNDDNYNYYFSLKADESSVNNVNNTSDANKPVSTATQNALNLKADKTAISNINNTSDVSKPVSTATQTALNLKANLASPDFTGLPTAPTRPALDNSSYLANTYYVDRAVYYDAKDSAVVHKAGGETITGTKTFSSAYPIILPNLTDPAAAGLHFVRMGGDGVLYYRNQSETYNDLGLANKANLTSPVFTGTVAATQYKLSALNTAPASATDTGTLGEIRVTSTYIYICTATNTWVRSALTTW